MRAALVALLLLSASNDQQSIKINGTRVRWQNLSQEVQHVRVVWRCADDRNADDFIQKTREIRVPPTAAITVQSGFEDSPILCNRVCEIDVGYLTPWPPSATEALPEFKGLLLSASSKVVCR